MRFSDITGNEEAKRQLRNLVDTNRIPHALLLSGPPGLGKMMLARAFVQYAHCQSPVGGEPCGRCPSCLQHQSLNHPDLYFTFPFTKADKRKICDEWAPEWNKFLKENPYAQFEAWHEMMGGGATQPVIYVPEALEIIRRMSLSGASSSRKFQLIWLPENMVPETANKMLKIVEEPADGTFFIMVSNQPQKILPTIFSRVQRINLKRLSEQEIAAELIRRGITTETDAARVARGSEGNLCRAIEMGSRRGEEQKFSKIFQDMMRLCYSVDVARLKALSEDVAKADRVVIRRFLAYCIRMLRENFVYNLGVEQLCTMTEEEERFSQRFAPFIHAGNVEDMAEQLTKAELDISRNGNAKMVLFDLMLQLMILIKRKI